MKYQLFQSEKDQKYYFKFLTDKEDEVLNSAGYKDKKMCEQALQFALNAASDSKNFRLKEKDGKHFFDLVGTDNRPIGKSGEFSSKDARNEAVKMMQSLGGLSITGGSSSASGSSSSGGGSKSGGDRNLMGKGTFNDHDFVAFEKGGKFFYEFTKGGQVMLKSPTYNSAEDCQAGLQAVMNNAGNAKRYAISKTKDGKFTFNLTDDKGAVLGGGPSFPNKDLLTTAVAMLAGKKGAKVVGNSGSTTTTTSSRSGVSAGGGANSGRDLLKKGSFNSVLFTMFQNTKDNKYYYEFTDGSGNAVLSSAGFANREEAQKSLDQVLMAGALPANYGFRSTGGKYFFDLKSSDGKALGSSIGFSSKGEAEKFASAFAGGQSESATKTSIKKTITGVGGAVVGGAIVNKMTGGGGDDINITEDLALAKEKAKAEELRMAEERRKAEEFRLKEEKRIAEEKRLIDERAKAEEKRLAEEKRKLDEAHKAEEKRLAAESKKAEEARKAEEKRIAEENRLAAEKRKAEQTRLEAEQKAKAEELRIKEEKRKAEELRLKEQKRLADEKRKAEELRLAEERKRKAAAAKVETTRKAATTSTTSTATKVAGGAATAATAGKVAVETSSRSGCMKWLPLLLIPLIGLLAWFGFKGCGGEAAGLAGAAKDKVVVAADKTKDAAGAVVDKTKEVATDIKEEVKEVVEKKALGPNGDEMKFRKGTLEANMANFLSDPNSNAPKTLVMETIDWPKDSPKMNQRARNQVKNIAAVMKKYPNAKIAINGFREGNEPVDYNHKGEVIGLDDIRARCLYRKLNEQGISKSRMSFNGKGVNKDRNRLEVIVTNK